MQLPKIRWISAETFNVLQLAVGLMLVFFAFLSQAFVVETVLQNRHKEDPSISKHAGYYSQTMVYGAFIISNIIAPPVVYQLGVRITLIMGGCAYTLFMIGFQFVNSYYLYITAILEGLCAGLLWTSAGHYLSINSNERTIARNSSMMWLIYMSSIIFGGIFMLIVFGSKATRDISMSTTRVLYGVFAGVALCGTIVLGTLRQPKNAFTEESNYKKELKKTLHMLSTLDMWLLAVSFSFSGMELSFWSSIYSTSLSFTKSFNMNTNSLMAFNSICTGLGELIGGIAFMIFGERTNKTGRYPIMWLGTVAAIIAYVLVWINIPGNASFEPTLEEAIIEPSIAIGLVCGVLLGFVDCCVNTQKYSFVSQRYKGRTTQAFALHKLFHAALTTVCMFYGSVFSLHIQLIILVIGSMLASLTFTIVEKRFERKQKLSQKVIPPLDEKDIQIQKQLDL